MSEQANHKLITGTMIYALGNIGTKLLSFAIVPLYTYYITTEQNGLYENLTTLANLLLPLITLQVADAVYTRMLQQNRVDRALIAQAYRITLIGSALLSAGVLLFELIFPFQDGLLFLLYTLGQAFLALMQKIVRGLGKQSLFAWSGIVYTIVFLSGNLIGILILHLQIQALLGSAIVAALAAMLFLWIRASQLHVSPFQHLSRSQRRELLAFSVPLIPNQINWWVMNSSDKFLITTFLSLSANGIYGIACKFPTLLLTVLDFFNTSWMDFAISADKSEKGYYTALFKRLYLFGFSLLIPLIPASMIVIEWIMAPAYRSAMNYVGFLYLGTLFQAFSSFYGVGYLKSRKTRSASSTSIYGAICNAALDLLLLPFIGLQAAAFSTFAGFFVMWLVREHQNRSVLDIRISWGLFYGMLGLVCLDIVFCFWATFWIKLLVVSVGGLLFLVLNRAMIRAVFEVAQRIIRR